MPKILSMNSQTDGKISFRFDLDTLNAFIGLIFKDSRTITKKTLGSLYSLMSMLDEQTYIGNPILYERVLFIKRALEAKLVERLQLKSAIIDYCSQLGNDICSDIITNIDRYSKLSYDDIKYLIKMIEDRLMFSFIEYISPKLYEILENKDAGKFKTYGEISRKLASLAKEYLSYCRSVENLDVTDSFSLLDTAMEDSIEKIYKEITQSSNILYTGIQSLNTMLSPGYLGGRLYTYLGLPGGFKSALLLKSAIDIRKYNKNFNMRDPSKIPTILLLTMENTVTETVERLFNMVVDSDEDLRDSTVKQIIKRLQVEGQLKFKGDGDANIIIKFAPNMSIDTDDLYTIIDDLNDDGQECIVLILDYIKRIRSANRRTKDEKEELKNVTNELHNLAIHYNIPVITAHQLNREAARIVDAALNGSGLDATDDIGRAHIGSAWEIMENSDFACVINKSTVRGERETSTSLDDNVKQYLTFKLLKIRYKAMSNISKFSQPFVENSTIRLEDDIGLPKPISVENLNLLNMSGIDQPTSIKKNRKGVKRTVVDNDCDLVLDDILTV